MINEIFTRDNEGNLVLLHSEEVPDPPKKARWEAMNNALLNSGAILTKMRTASGMNQFFTLVFAVIQNGANGFAAEDDLETLLKLPGWGFSNGEKTTINNYFSNNDFSITI